MRRILLRLLWMAILIAALIVGSEPSVDFVYRAF